MDDRTRDEIVDELDDETVAELEQDAADRGLTVSGSGSGGNVVKQDYVEAIADDETAPEDTSGRPPLTQIAQDRASNVTERHLAQEEN